jgi:hypothetical protein
MEISQYKLGRIIQALHPEMVKEILNDFTPLTDDLAIIPEMYHAMNGIFPDLEDFDRKVLFIALVYRSFAPQTFLPPILREDGKDRLPIGKLPAGVRDKIAQQLGFVNSEMANHYKAYAEAHVKNSRYRAKMKQVTDYLGLTQPAIDGSPFGYKKQAINTVKGRL